VTFSDRKGRSVVGQSSDEVLRLGEEGIEVRGRWDEATVVEGGAHRTGREEAATL
jgi:hypothetical protein